MRRSRTVHQPAQDIDRDAAVGPTAHQLGGQIARAGMQIGAGDDIVVKLLPFLRPASKLPDPVIMGAAVAKVTAEQHDDIVDQLPRFHFIDIRQVVVRDVDSDSLAARRRASWCRDEFWLRRIAGRCIKTRPSRPCCRPSRSGWR